MIQKAWRRHIDRQVFQYYQQLISFQDKRGAQFLLRCINPAESKLLDEASGSHVRFRLGGVRFPPSIYYKIYTNRNIADVGAFAPRSYTKAENKDIPSRYVHNRGLVIDDPSINTDDWYERHENNGWRMVNQRHYQLTNTDEITTRTSQKRINFPHEKLARQQDVQRRRKQKKIKWMKKMYSAGMMQSTDDEAADLVQEATKGLILTADAEGEDAVHDWEIDELLQWTEGLNYDNYLKDWHTYGTAFVERENQFP